METTQVSDKIEREAVGVEFSHSMGIRDQENARRGGIRINQDDLFKTIENSNLTGLDITPKQVDEIVTDSDSDSDEE